ncbi:MAG: hypothetical protein WCF19_07430, partial [Chlamydiales bacterium]
MFISVTPILPLRERHRDEGSPHRFPKSIDTKVRGFVLDRMSQTRERVLPPASAAQTVLGFLAPLDGAKEERAPRARAKPKLRRNPIDRRRPIGLVRVEPEGWLNALMQFVLYVHGFAEGFDFVPRSWYPMREFIDQYHQDQQENRQVSSASGEILFQCLKGRLSGLSIPEMCQSLFDLIHAKWEIHGRIEEALRGDLAGDLFVAQNSPSKQIFAGPGLCYDLNAFIEKRSDEVGVNYVAYVKVDGLWFQCDDERITQIRSDSLALPLLRGIFAHY